MYAAGTVLGGWLAALANSHELLTCTRQGHLSHWQRSPQKVSIPEVTPHKMRLLRMLPCILYAPSAISSSTSNTTTVRLTTQPVITSYFGIFALISILSCVLQTMPVALWVVPERFRSRCSLWCIYLLARKKWKVMFVYGKYLLALIGL